MSRWFVIFLVVVGQQAAAQTDSGALHAQASGATFCSGTLPVLHIDTADSIKSKEEYVDGTYYLDNMGQWQFESIGSASEPLPVQMRGRGNWTWTGAFAKKPYKIKLGQKQPLMGMAANKHWALLAHADGTRPFFRNAAGFFLSRRVLKGFTPSQQPVELILNGKYQGLYFLTETIRVGKNRVNITEQADNETDPELISGGWLVELDNGIDEQQLRFSTRGTDLGYFLVTYSSPEELSLAQRSYLRQQMQRVLDTVYCDDKSSTDWEQIIDMPTLASFYLVNEVIDNVEAFLGSCYLHKDRGQEKWLFGPVWDMGHAFSSTHPKDEYCYIYDNGWSPGIINEIVKFPRFQEEVRRQWPQFYPGLVGELKKYLIIYAQRIKRAAQLDARRWHYAADIDQQLSDCLLSLDVKCRFLQQQFQQPVSSIGTIATTEATGRDAVYSLSGQRLQQPPRRGLYIKNKRIFIDN